MNHRHVMLIFSLVLLTSSCSHRRQRAAAAKKMAVAGADAVTVVMAPKDFRPTRRCSELGRLKVIWPNLHHGELPNALEELKQRAFMRGADHAVVVDYTDELLYADLFFCSRDYSDFK